MPWKILNLKGLDMNKENPEDSVRQEQNGAEMNAAGTEDANKAEMTEENEASGNSGESEENEKILKEVSREEEKEKPFLILWNFTISKKSSFLLLIIQVSPRMSLLRHLSLYNR